jgi:hypothetical protein
MVYKTLIMSNKEKLSDSDKLSELFWSKNGYSVDQLRGQSDFVLSSEDKVNFKKLVALEAKIDLIYFLYNERGHLEYDDYVNYYRIYTEELKQLKEELGI